MPASSPVPALPIYPSTPMICPAKNKSARSPILQRRLQQARCIDVGVAVQHAIAQEFRLFQTRESGAAPRACVTPAQIGLEADDVIERSSQIVLPQLHHGKRPFTRPRIDQPHWPHRAKANAFCPAPPSPQRHTALKEVRIFRSNCFNVIVSAASRAAQNAHILRASWGS